MPSVELNGLAQSSAQSGSAHRKNDNDKIRALRGQKGGFFHDDWIKFDAETIIESVIDNQFNKSRIPQAAAQWLQVPREPHICILSYLMRVQIIKAQLLQNASVNEMSIYDSMPVRWYHFDGRKFQCVNSGNSVVLESIYGTLERVPEGDGIFLLCELVERINFMVRSLHFALGAALRRATEDWFAIPGLRRGHQSQREFPPSQIIPRTENGKSSSSTKRLNASGNTKMIKTGASESSQRGSQQTSQQVATGNPSHMSLRQHNQLLQQMQKKSSEIAPQAALENKTYAVSKNADIFPFNFSRPNPKNHKDGINSLINENSSRKDVPTMVATIDGKQIHSDTVGYFSNVKGNEAHSINSIFAIKDEDIHLDMQHSGSKGSQQFDGGIEIFQDGLEESANSKKASVGKENHETTNGSVQESASSNIDRESSGEKSIGEKSKFTYPNPPKEMTLDEFDSNNDRSPSKSEVQEGVVNGIGNHGDSIEEKQEPDSLDKNQIEDSKKKSDRKGAFKTMSESKENKDIDVEHNRKPQPKNSKDSCPNSSGVGEKGRSQEIHKSKRKNSFPIHENENSKKKTKIELGKEKQCSLKGTEKIVSGNFRDKEVVGMGVEEDNYGLELDENAPSL
eukprot:jgi/Bigna1/81552/fgenesh1_pg.81_\